MTTSWKRIGLGFGAAAMAVLLLGTGYQDISAQGPSGGDRSVARAGDPGGPGWRGGPGGPGGFGRMLMERLDLTADQRDRVRQIRESHREELQALGKRAMQAHQQLQEATSSANFDESAVRARAAEAAVVDADMAVAQARIFSEIYQILTPEQQERLKTMQANMKQREQRMQERRGRR